MGPGAGVWHVPLADASGRCRQPMPVPFFFSFVWPDSRGGMGRVPHPSARQPVKERPLQPSIAHSWACRQGCPTIRGASPSPAKKINKKNKPTFQGEEPRESAQTRPTRADRQASERNKQSYLSLYQRDDVDPDIVAWLAAGPSHVGRGVVRKSWEREHPALQQKQEMRTGTLLRQATRCLLSIECGSAVAGRCLLCS